jgi:hypothetical protein
MVLLLTLISAWDLIQNDGMLMKNKYKEMWAKEAKSSFKIMLQHCIWGLTIANINVACTLEYSHPDHKMPFAFTTCILIGKNKNEANQFMSY